MLHTDTSARAHAHRRRPPHPHYIRYIRYTGGDRAILVLLNPSREPLPALQHAIPLYYSGLVGSACVRAFDDPSDEDGNVSVAWTHECPLDLLGRCTLAERLVPPESV